MNVRGCAFCNNPVKKNGMCTHHLNMAAINGLFLLDAGDFSMCIGHGSMSKRQIKQLFGKRVGPRKFIHVTTDTQIHDLFGKRETKGI